MLHQLVNIEDYQNMLLLSNNHIDTSTTMGITSIRNCSRDPNLFISIWLHLVCPNVHSSSPGVRYIIHCILKSTKELHFFSACLKSLGINCAWMLLSKRTSSSYLMNSSQLLLLWWLVCTTFNFWLWIIINIPWNHMYCSGTFSLQRVTF